MIKPQYKLWLSLEGNPSPDKFEFTQDDVGVENPDLNDLAKVLCKKNKRIKELKVDAVYLEFFGDTSSRRESDSMGDEEPLCVDILVEHLKTSAKSPLIVRYPLSSKTSKSICYFLFLSEFLV